MTIDTNTLPPADAEQRHLVDEIEHADQYDGFQHEFAVRCGNCGAIRPVTVQVSVTQDEAGR